MESLEDLLLDLIEVKAYRENQDYKDKEYYTLWWIYDIDTNEKDDPTSEDEYFSITQQNLEEAILWYDDNNPKPNKKTHKIRLNKYDRKMITKQKLEKLKRKCAYYVIYERENYLERNYRSNHTGKFNRSSYYKKYSNAKVRRTNEFKLTGNGYRKLFDYWWEVD